MAGRVGRMPTVTSQSSAATSAASRTARSKAAGSPITWSAAKEPSTASGSSRSSSAAAYPIAAMESRGEGSATTRPGGRWPSWASTCSRCLAPVTTSTRSPAVAATRATVSWSSDRPVPVRSWRNFGEADRDSGHSRVPEPPAGTTAQKCSIAAMGVTLE